MVNLLEFISVYACSSTRGEGGAENKEKEKETDRREELGGIGERKN